MGRLQIVEDGWTPDDGTDYSPDEFYVRSTNKHDHAESVRLRLPSDLLAQMGALVASGRIPEYRTPSDVMRDALQHRLRYLNQRLEDGDLERVLNLELSGAVADRINRELEDARNVLDGWERTLRNAADMRDVGLLDTSALRAREIAEGWREPYRTRLLEIVERYAHRLV